MTEVLHLPDLPTGTVAFLATAGGRPHVIPVSAVVRAGDDRLLLGLARRRESLARLRADPRVTVSLAAADIACSVDGMARVVDEHLTDAVVAVGVDVDAVHDHRRDTFTLHDGVVWEWTDADARAADAEVHAALRRLAGG